MKEQQVISITKRQRLVDSLNGPILEHAFFAKTRRQLPVHSSRNGHFLAFTHPPASPRLQRMVAGSKRQRFFGGNRERRRSVARFVNQATDDWSFAGREFDGPGDGIFPSHPPRHADCQ